MQENKVSVILPAHNMGTTIENAVNSVVSQTYRNWELIIVDDGSTDRTKDFVRYCNLRYDHRIRCLTNSRNYGRSVSLNIGIANSRGCYITFLDADDVFDTSGLESRAAYLDAHPEKDAVFANTAYANREGFVYTVRVPPKSFLQSRNQSLDFLTSVKMAFHPMSLMYRRSVFDRIGCFDEQLRRKQDGDLVIRLLANCNVGYVEQTVYRYNVNGTTPLQRVRKRLRGILCQQRILKKHTRGIQRVSLTAYSLVVDSLKLVCEIFSYRK